MDTRMRVRVRGHCEPTVRLRLDAAKSKFQSSIKTDLPIESHEMACRRRHRKTSRFIEVLYGQRIDSQGQRDDTARRPTKMHAIKGSDIVPTVRPNRPTKPRPATTRG